MTTTTPAPELLSLDPAELMAESNVRADLGDLDGLISSVRAVGVLEPVIVAPNGDGRFHIVAGFRRVAAAQAAGAPVPCLVRPDLVDGSRVVAQLAENLRREDLSAAEEAAGYEQLRAFGLDEAAIAAQVGTAPEVVSKGLAVAKAPKAMAVAAKYLVSLDEAAALAEFEDDAAVIKDLTLTLQREPQMFTHTLSRARQDRADRLKREELVRSLGDVPLCKTRPGYDLVKGRPCRLDELRNEAGKAITPAKHRKCPGHAGFVLEQWGLAPKLVWVCMDAVANGHKGRHASPGSSKRASSTDDETPETKAAASAERRLVIGNNKAWRAAETVRTTWLEELYLRTEAPKGSLRYAVEAILGDTRLLSDYGHALRGEELAKSLEVPDARLPLLLVRLACQAMERSMTVDAWRRPPTGTAAYLRFLGSTGYPLSEVERTSIEASEKRGARGY